MSENFAWLQHWFRMHCDGKWEHACRVKIENLDNPGWSVLIYFRETKLEGHSIARVVHDASEDDWWSYWTEHETFRAACGPDHLDRMIGIFRQWAIRLAPESAMH
jgi:hypothetical protein